MTKEKALNMAIFALNTLQHPDASSREDMAILDSLTDEVLTVLIQMRNGEIEESRFITLEARVTAVENRVNNIF